MKLLPGPFLCNSETYPFVGLWVEPMALYPFLPIETFETAKKIEYFIYYLGNCPYEGTTHPTFSPSGIKESDLFQSINSPGENRLAAKTAGPLSLQF